MIKRGLKSGSSPEVLKETLRNLEEAFGDWEKLLSVSQTAAPKEAQAPQASAVKETEVVLRARRLLLDLKEQLDELS